MISPLLMSMFAGRVLGLRAGKIKMSMPFCGDFGHIGMRFHVGIMLFEFLRRICSILWYSGVTKFSRVSNFTLIMAENHIQHLSCLGKL